MNIFSNLQYNIITQILQISYTLLKIPFEVKKQKESQTKV
jgi:hypothetical protein